MVVAGAARAPNEGAEGGRGADKDKGPTKGPTLAGEPNVGAPQRGCAAEQAPRAKETA